MIDLIKCDVELTISKLAYNVLLYLFKISFAGQFMRKIDRFATTWQIFSRTLLPEVDNVNVVLTIIKLIIFDRPTLPLNISCTRFRGMFSRIKFAFA